MVTRGSIDFGDVAGKLTYLRIECDKCGRRGRYAVERLLAQYGRRGRLMDWSDQLTTGCPRRANLDRDRCGAICPDLHTVV